MPGFPMKQTPLPTYSALDQALSHTTFKLHPAEAHGIIAGILCGDANELDWQMVITGDAEEKIEKTDSVLQTLYDATNKQLHDFLFELQLLLPEDDEELRARACALTLWCQGFLTGLKLAHVPFQVQSNSEMTETINDLIEISKMNYEEVVASEEDEAAFVELVEYVRMAVILLYQDLRDEAPKIAASNQLH
jgi:uncharacterized protein